MIQKALEYLVKLGKPMTVNVDGRAYTAENLSPIFEEFPRAINVSTLSALVQYLDTDPDGLSKTVLLRCANPTLILHVVSPNCVTLNMPMIGAHNQREVLMVAQPMIPEQHFNHYIDAEEMVVALQSKFVPSVGDWAKVVAVAGTVTDGITRDYADDGISQAVTVRAGISTKADVAMPNPAILAPYRTFPEIEQPSSRFLFRAKSGGEKEKPRFALFEADGGAWRIEAMQRIKTYLELALPQRNWKDMDPGKLIGSVRLDAIILD